jgi:deoxyribonuclease-4
MKIGAHIPSIESLVGSHVSSFKDFDEMARYARQIECECIQIFAKSPRQWRAKSMTLQKREEIERAREIFDFGPVLTHTAYLINVVTDKQDIYEKSIPSLGDELVRGAILQAAGVNTHLGSVPGGDRDEAVLRGARAIERAFAFADEKCATLGIACDTRLILENSAGAGNLFGNTIAELCAVIKETKVARERLGICIDTCHAWAYGYDVATETGWNEIVDEFKSHKMLDLWQFIHANDCKFARGEKKDRHAWIGEGEIGFEGFRIMLHLGQVHPELAGIAVLTEMPGDPPDKDIVNIQALKALRDRKV